MIQFPGEATREWNSIAARVEKSLTVRRRIERDVAVANKVEDHWQKHEAKLKFEQELAAQDTPPLEMMTVSDYIANPAAVPVDMIDGVMKENGVMVVLGPSGAGKSTLALQLVHSLMTGTPFLTQQVTQVIAGGVGVMSYDMDASMMHNWMAGWSGPGVDFSKVSVVNAHRQGNPLTVPHQRQQIVDAWRDLKVEVVVIDSFSASFFGSDQNDAAATMNHYRELKKFALTDVGAKVLILVVHASPGGAARARGSSVHEDAPDTIMAVEKTEDGSRKVRMNKYRTIAGTRSAEMSEVVLTKPDSVTNLVGVDQASTMFSQGSAGSEGLAYPDTKEEPDTSVDEREEDDEGSD